MDTPKATILVVDDEPYLLMGLCDILEFYGYLTVRAAQGQQALDILAQGQDVLPDLILTDINHVPINGLEMIRIIRDNRDWNRIPVIVLSAAVTEEVANEARQLGANAAMAKPFDAEELLEVVAQWVNSE